MSDYIDKDSENRIKEWNAFQSYIDGYRKSICILTKELRNDINLVYPLTFLIAHYIELEIKYLNLIWGNIFFEVYTIKSLNLTRNHSLIELIDASIDEWIDAGITNRDIAELKEYVIYFESYAKDRPLSESMRYPVDVNGKLIFNEEKIEDLEEINISEYINKTVKLLNILLIIEISHKLYNQNSIKMFMDHKNGESAPFDDDLKELEEVIKVYQLVLEDLRNSQ